MVYFKRQSKFKMLVWELLMKPLGKLDSGCLVVLLNSCNKSCHLFYQYLFLTLCIKWYFWELHELGKRYLFVGKRYTFVGTLHEFQLLKWISPEEKQEYDGENILEDSFVRNKLLNLSDSFYLILNEIGAHAVPLRTIGNTKRVIDSPFYIYSASSTYELFLVPSLGKETGSERY